MAATLQAHCPAIHCEGCANAIKRSLGKLAGVHSVEVDIPGKNVTVQYDEAQVGPGAIRERLLQAGFAPE
ncbi:MAG TPA: heavy-metal-associated domain-containing protein [Chthonomonadaceae bacterium]|nr:heavy-metal-associated domain-containing protein [Chthonomonadaceae bacterium]